MFQRNIPGDANAQKGSTVSTDKAAQVRDSCEINGENHLRPGIVVRRPGVRRPVVPTQRQVVEASTAGIALPRKVALDTQVRDRHRCIACRMLCGQGAHEAPDARMAARPRPTAPRAPPKIYRSIGPAT